MKIPAFWSGVPLLLGIGAILYFVGDDLWHPVQPEQAPKPYVEPQDDTPGGRFYKLNCATCHNSNGPGTVTLSKRLQPNQDPILSLRTDLDPAYIDAVVRNGIGIMPHFTKIELPGETMKSLQDYLSPEAGKARAEKKRQAEL